MKTIPHRLRLYTAALLLITCCILLLTSCEKDPYRHGEPDLPPITMEGKNTLGFLLNGKVWVPYQDKPGIFTPTLLGILDGTTNNISIEARYRNLNKEVDQINISIAIDDERIYLIPNEASINFFYHKYQSCRKFKTIS